MNKKSLLSKAGFTLIEILVVVAIIGILAGVVLVGLRGTGPQARDSRRASDLKQVQNGLELYYNKNGSYPPSGSWADLRGDLVGSSAGLGIANLPQDPQNDPNDANSPTYEYISDSNGTTYVLKATFEVADSKLLDNDIDNDTLPTGITNFDCDGSNYCIAL